MQSRGYVAVADKEISERMKISGEEIVTYLRFASFHIGEATSKHLFILSFQNLKRDDAI